MSAAPPTTPRQGPHFSYLMPEGWAVGEEGPHALVLRSPDAAAGIIVFGLSGMPVALDPVQFAMHAMRDVMRLAPDVQLWNPRAIAPRPGFTAAAAIDTRYTLFGPTGPAPVLGLVVSNVAVGYGFGNGVITIAGAQQAAWPSVASWLPGVALAAVNTGPNAYGSTGMAAQMHGIARQEGDAQARYRAWSAATWDAVVQQRAEVGARQADALDPVLTGQRWDADPFGGPMARRSTAPRVVWVHRDGREVASDDPSFDPRTPMDADWRRVDR